MNPERAELIKEYVELSRAIKTLDSYCLFKSAKWFFFISYHSFFFILMLLSFFSFFSFCRCSELLLSIELTSDERKLLARIEEKTKPFDTTEETDKVFIVIYYLFSLGLFADAYFFAL